MTPFRLGIDALNALADERGMGRVFRSVVRHAVDEGDIEVTLFVAHPRERNRYEHALLRERFALAKPGGARKRKAFDAVWYPWNAVRFASAAPSLVVMHDAFAFSEPARGWIARRREAGPIRRAAREASLIAVDSEYSRREVMRYLAVDPARIVVVPPQPASFWTPGDPDELPPELAGRRFILSVGGPEARKNMELLISAHALAFPHGDPVLCIAGRLSEGAERLARANGVVRMRPSDPQLRSLYRCALAVAVPSRAEGFGLVVAEAMACGAAVIAANASALPEVAGDAGMLVPPDDAQAWVAGLRALVNDEMLARSYRERGAARFAFTPRDQYSGTILALLRSLAR